MRPHPPHVREAALHAYAETGSLTEAAAAVGLPLTTVHDWAKEARESEQSEATPTVSLADIWREAQLDAAKRGRELLKTDTKDAAEAAQLLQAASRFAHVAGNLHLDHTVGRRGTQPQNLTVVNGTDAILALVQARLALAAPVSIEEVSDGEGVALPEVQDGSLQE